MLVMCHLGEKMETSNKLKRDQAIVSDATPSLGTCLLLRSRRQSWLSKFAQHSRAEAFMLPLLPGSCVLWTLTLFPRASSCLLLMVPQEARFLLRWCLCVIMYQRLPSSLQATLSVSTSIFKKGFHSLISTELFFP